MVTVYDRVPGVTDFEHLSTTEAAETFRAVDVETGHTVLVKVLSNEASDDLFDRFTSVCRAVRSIDRHPNVATLYDAGSTSDGHPYLVTEYHGRSLADLIAQHGRLRWQETIALGAEIASALEAAHRMSVVHGEVSPANILLDNDDVPRLTDFGVRALQTAPDTTGAAGRSSLARLAHTAPEVVQGRVADERSDVYSLASTLFEALAGAPPFIRSSDESVVPVVSRLLGEGPPSLASIGVPGPVEAAIVGAMAKDPSQRPSSAELFRQELLAAARTAAGPEVLAAAAAADGEREATLGRRSDRTRSMDGPQRQGVPRRRKRGIDFAIAAVALVAIVGIIVVATRSGKKDSSAAGTTVAAQAPGDSTVTSTTPGTEATTTVPQTTKATTTVPPSTEAPTTDAPTTDAPTTDAPGEPTTSTAALDPGDTITLAGTGFHISTFVNAEGGATITYPADHQAHYFTVSIQYEGNKFPLLCAARTRPQVVSGSTFSSLSFGGCLQDGQTETKIRVKSWGKGTVKVSLYLCDVKRAVNWCEGSTRSTNTVDLTFVAT